MPSSNVCFDWASSFYDYSRAIPKDLIKKTLDTLQEKVNLTSNARILEVGIGTGRIAIPLSTKFNLDVIGIDISEKMLQKCKEKISPSTSVQLIIANGLTLPFANNHFEVIYTSHTVHLLPNVFHFIEKITPLLVQNGYYINLDAYVSYDQTIPFKIYYDKLAEVGYRHIHRWELLRRELMIYLSRRGWKHSQSIIESEREISINNIVRFIRDRVFSHQRAIADEFHHRSLKHLYIELERKNIDLSERISVPATSRLNIFQKVINKEF